MPQQKSSYLPHSHQNQNDSPHHSHPANDGVQGNGPLPFRSRFNRSDVEHLLPLRVSNSLERENQDSGYDQYDPNDNRHFHDLHFYVTEQQLALAFIHSLPRTVLRLRAESGIGVFFTFCRASSLDRVASPFQGTNEESSQPSGWSLFFSPGQIPLGLPGNTLTLNWERTLVRLSGNRFCKSNDRKIQSFLDKTAMAPAVVEAVMQGSDFTE
jgi:hypothetical protein